jgi:hypothetical protein
MAIVQISYPATGLAMTCTITSLASSGTAGRASTSVDNSVNLDDDAFIWAQINYPNLAPANDKFIYLYGYGSYDGTNYPELITGTDAAYTIAGAAGALTTALRLVGIIPAIQNTTQNFGPFPLSPCFGGLMPVKWGIVVLNFSGQTLAATNCNLHYTRVQYTVT